MLTSTSIIDTPQTRRANRRTPPPRVPRYAAALFESLRVDAPSSTALSGLTDAEWRKLLALCDRQQLTLMLPGAAGDAMPAWVRSRIAANTQTFAARFERLEQSLAEIADALDRRGIGFILLKGAAHSPDFTPDPLLRHHGDIDLWCDPPRILEARDALADLGYRVCSESRGRHLPPMARDTHWQWTGDYFAADLPVAVELHYELWDQAAEFIPAPGSEAFWGRRTAAFIAGRRLPVLSTADTLAFACLHLLMHVLHGDVRLQRAWEIARFLHLRENAAAFWSSWRNSHPAPLRRLEAVVFDMVARWFGAALSGEAQEEVDALPSGVRLWLERYSNSPVEGLFHSNKDEVWLHLALLDSFRRKWSIFARRVFPVQAPARAVRGSAPLSMRLIRATHLASRASHHARSLVPTLLGAARWRWRREGLHPDFLRFQAVAALYGLGVVVFVVLYNLYLLKLGFHEDFLGKAAGLTTTGTLVGSLPAAALVRRIGLRASLLVTIAGVSAASFARAWSHSGNAQLAASFVSGLFFSIWAVCNFPAIAALSTERNRPFAFSVSCSLGMSMCAVGGLASGILPGVVGRVFHLPDALGATRGALLAAAGAVAFSAIAAVRLRFPVRPPAKSSGPAIRSAMLPLLLTLGLWAAAVGVFNPFFNAYFATRMRMGAGRIAMIFSVSQVLQAAAMLCAPLMLKRLGQVRGIAGLQLATGASLLLLAFAPGGLAASALYAAYCCFQYTSEPGIFSLLMDRAAPDERSRISALYFVATSVAASLAAWAGGAAIARFGYAATLTAAAATAMFAAALFRFVLAPNALTRVLQDRDQAAPRPI